MTDANTTAPVKRPGVVNFIGIEWNLGALKTASRGYWLWVGFLASVFLVGLVGYLTFFTHGGVVMNMRDGNPWGLWFTDYMYYVGLAAGGLVVYASVHLFGAEQFRPLARIAVLQAGVLTMMALLGVITDFERPLRMVSFVLTPNPTAPFVYTGTAAGIYMVLCFVDLWVMITGKGGEKLAFTMTLIALPFAIYLHTTTAFVLALNKSRELWNAAVMVPIFLTSATASGVALLIIFAYVMQATGQLKFKPSMFRSLSTLLATVIIMDLFLLIVEIGVVFWPTSAQPGHTVRMMQFVWGPYSFTLWTLLILGITAFTLLARRNTRHIPAVQITASAMYVVAIFIKRYMLMGMGFVLTPLGQPTGIYAPSFVEITMALGILAFGLLFVTAAIKVLPVKVPEEEGHHVDWSYLDKEFEAEAAAEAKAAAQSAEQPSLEPEVAP